MTVKIKITKLEEFKAAMYAKSAALKLELPRCVKEAAEAGRETAMEKVPKDSGNLRDSIETYISNDEALIKTEERYAPYVEFGTKSHGAAQPYMRPAQKIANKVLMDKVLEVVKKK